jgi:hypothetical protein
VVNAALYSPYQQTGTSAVFTYQQPRATRTLSAIRLRKSEGEWVVAEFSACGELIHPESNVTNSISGQTP